MPKIQLSDAEIVKKDKEDLIIYYAHIDSASAVTQDIHLPLKGPYGTDISWKSDNPLVLKNNGKITRPHYTESDVTVTLTATITKGSISDTRKFTITIKKGKMSDEEAAAWDKAKLKIGYAQGDNCNSVTQDLYLPTKGDNGSRISWYPQSSDSSGDIYSDGRVFRPNYLDENTVITIVAVIQKGSAIYSRHFYVTLIKEEISHADAVALDTESLEIGFAPGDSESSVTQNINLPRNGENGTSIIWGSYNQDIVGTNGRVRRPSSSETDVVVKLTATISKRMVSDEKEFLLTVKKEEMNEIEAVASDKASLNIDYKSGDSSSGIKEDISLPIKGSNGTSISWSSDKPSIIGADGKVNRPSSSQPDAIVILTATIRKGSASDTKQFKLTVKKSDVSNPNTPSENAYLKRLSIREKELSPSFNMDTYNYEIDVSEEINTINLSATVYDEKASMKINDISVPQNTSRPIELNIGENVVTIEVTAEDNKHCNKYTILINRNKQVYEKSEIEKDIKEANSIDSLKEAYIHVNELDDKDKEDVLKVLTNKSLNLMNSLEDIDFIQSVIDEIKNYEQRKVYEKRIAGKKMIFSEEYKSWNEHKNSPQPINKIWSVTFNSKLDDKTIKVGDDYFTVLDEDGYRIGIKLEYFEEIKTVKITPINNYKSDKKYYLIIGKNIKSHKGDMLKRKVRVEFSVEK